MTKKGKVKKVNGISIPTDKVSDVKLSFIQTGTIPTTGLKPASKIKVLARSVANRCISFILRRTSVDHLDAALTAKLGKAPNKSQIVRHGHKMYNQGFKDAIKKYQDNWI